MTFWMLATSAMAPTPLSPHMSTFDTGCITLTPQETSVSICPDVHGWFHLQQVGVLIKKLPCRHQLQSLVANDMLLRAWDKSAGWVKCHYIAVFIAGATTRCLHLSPKSHARARQVRRLSQIPFESLARVFAERGATSRRCAHRRNSMCVTGSPRCFQAPHSSSSVHTRTPFASRALLSKKCAPLVVVTTCTLNDGSSASTSSSACAFVRTGR